MTREPDNLVRDVKQLRQEESNDTEGGRLKNTKGGKLGHKKN